MTVAARRSVRFSTTRVVRRWSHTETFGRMTDFARDIILAGAGLLVMAALFWCRRRGRPLSHQVWPYLVAGFALLCFGRVLEMTSTSAFLIAPLLKIILQEAVGFCLGFVLLAVALVKWLPDLTGREMTLPGTHHPRQGDRRRAASRPRVAISSSLAPQPA